ncbi:MAG: cytochrome P450 [Actinomycetes bacterium]
MALPPGPQESRLRQTLAWSLRTPPFLGRNRERYGDVFTMRIAAADPIVVVSDPELVKKVFTGDPNILRAGEGNAILGPVLGDHSVLLLDGPEHLRHRKLLLPAFHGERMSAYTQLMRDVTNTAIDGWPVGENIPLLPRFQAITLDIILRAVFGLEPGDRQADPLREAMRKMMSWGTTPLAAIFMSLEANGKPGPWRLAQRAVDQADSLLYAHIAERRAAGDLADRDDVLSMLLQAVDEDGNGLTDQELRDELMTLLTAGHETTATALAWAYERLLRQPEDMERLREEALGDDVEDGWTDAVIREAMRRRPPIPMVVRKLSEPWTLREEDGPLPAGTLVAPAIWLIHHRPDIYPEPGAFKPERWLDTKPDTYRWLPFGGGVRRCLGASFALLEMREVLRTIVGRVELEVAGPAAKREPITRRAIVISPRHRTMARVAAKRPASEPVATGATA